MKNFNKKEKAPNTLRKTVVFFTAILFVISSVMTIENVVSTKDNELEERLGFVEPGGENWWNSSFYYRKLITINHSQVDEDLTNFPILVYRFKDDDLFSHAQVDGDDICFVLYSDNSTKLNHEIESYSIGTGWIWVNVTSLSSSTDTKLWMYYGNTTCNSQENIQGTWDSNFVLVQHLNEARSTNAGHYKDSTNYDNDGTLTDIDNDTVQTNGKVGKAIHFEGDADYITVFDSASLQVSTTMAGEIWLNKDSWLTRARPFSYWHTTQNKGWLTHFDTDRIFDIYIGGGSAQNEQSGIALASSGFSYIAWSYNSGTIDMYVNKNKYTTSTESSISTHDNDLFIGRSYTAADYFNGLIDEIRISNVARNQSWINVTYNTINNPSTFLTVGSEEASNRPPHMPSNPYPAHGSTSVNINVDLSWTGGDPDGNPVTYDVYLGTNSTPPKVANNQTATSYDPGTLDLDKTYYWKIIAWDNQSAFTEGPVWWFSTGTNQPPSKPIILSAPTFGMPEIQLDFSTVAMDPEGDQIYYMWDWGDGELSGWLGPFVSGQTAEAHHTWDESGEYEIKVKAKDSNDAESYWSEPVQIIIENNPPDIVITKPLPNMLYFGNQPLFPFFVTVIIGSIDIAVNASDDLSGMGRVEFYIKDVLKKTVTSAPYIWLWGGITFGLKLCDIKVIAYDNAGNHAYDTIMVWRFL